MTTESLFSIIKKIIGFRLKVGLTINFDGLGGFKIELKAGDEATASILKNI